jgi:hypothetical protein
MNGGVMPAHAAVSVAAAKPGETWPQCCGVRKEQVGSCIR